MDGHASLAFAVWRVPGGSAASLANTVAAPCRCLVWWAQVWLEPYEDFLGLGLVTTAAIAAYDNTVTPKVCWGISTAAPCRCLISIPGVVLVLCVFVCVCVCVW